MTHKIQLKIFEALETARREALALQTRGDEAWAIVEKQQRVLDQCPGCFPDGTGMMSPEQWIQWAKTQLGYRR